MKNVHKLLLFLSFLLPLSVAHGGDEPVYVVEDGLVDKATYRVSCNVYA